MMNGFGTKQIWVQSDLIIYQYRHKPHSHLTPPTGLVYSSDSQLIFFFDQIKKEKEKKKAFSSQSINISNTLIFLSETTKPVHAKNPLNPKPPIF